MRALARRHRTAAALVLPALAAAAVLLTGCGGGERSGADDAPSSPASGDTAPAGEPSDVSRMQKLVDDAESAVGKAESDAAADD
ncbi:hypothetical protein [Streptomyces sp. NPDC048639]|uniref:hypothetical protein n=1 Tax=Streptomyces sp. NPDC048639 TaxID=3365581 RepID=UPI0037223EED